MKKLGVSRPCPLRAARPPGAAAPAGRALRPHELEAVPGHIDYHVGVERHVYSVPYQLLREHVEVRYTTNTVEIFHRDKRMASHRRRFDRQPSTVPGHMPSAHRAHAEWSPSRLIGSRRLDRRPGSSSPKSCRAARTPSRAIALAWGSCSWGDVTETSGSRRPATRALALGFCRYQTVKNILSAGQDRLPLEPPAETNPTPTHANIRDADYYAATHEEEDRC